MAFAVNRWEGNGIGHFSWILGIIITKFLNIRDLQCKAICIYVYPTNLPVWF